MKIFYTLLTALFIKNAIQAEAIPLKPGSSYFTPPVQTTLDPETQVEIEKTKKELTEAITEAKRNYAHAQSLYLKNLQDQNKIKSQCDQYKKAYTVAKEYATMYYNEGSHYYTLAAGYTAQYKKADAQHRHCEKVTLKNAQINSQDLFNIQLTALHTLNALEAKLNKLQHTAVPVSKPAQTTTKTPTIIGPSVPVSAPTTTQPQHDPTDMDPYLRKHHTTGTFSLNNNNS